jgi:hypothetical protein
MIRKTTTLGIKFGYNQIKSTRMNKYLLLLVVSLLYMAPIFSQSDKDYDDLLELLVDEKYEKLVYKSESYFLNDKYSKDPLPYLYYSMGHYRFTQDEDLSTKYPKAFKEAMKFAGKFVKKDKESLYIDEAEDYFGELRATGMENAENQIINEKYTKAKGMYKYMCNLDQEDPGAKVYMSYTMFKMRSLREAQTFLEDAITILENRSIEELTSEQKTLLKNAIIVMTEWEGNSEYRSQISILLEKSKSSFSGQKDFDRAYDSFM